MNHREQRVLILAPTGRDAVMLQAALEKARVDSKVCDGFEDLRAEMHAGVGAVVVAEEAFGTSGMANLSEILECQPTWSDLPLLVLTRQGADSHTVQQAVGTLGNVTLLERPTRIGTIVSTARSALRARQRQYQIRAQMRELEQAADSLREGDRRKDEFLAVLAHELRNPLAPIRQCLQIMALDRGKAQSDELREMMERQVSHMVRLVDDLLEVSRITRGKIDLQKQPLDLASVLTTAIETSRPLIEASQHQLSIQYGSGPFMVNADEVRLTQVFANLLNNAAKYMERGGQIEVVLRREGADACVVIRDQGIGIQPEMLPRVFDMFAQIDKSRAQKGLGIGLTLARSLVELHGGRIDAHSEGAGKGSEFTVRLPLSSPIKKSQPRVVPMPHRHPLNLRVLVVDDNRDAANSLATLLKLRGAEVRAVYGGTQALACLQDYLPTVMIVDLGMPEMSGHELATRVRASARFDAVILVALSGWGQRKDLLKSREAGFAHHLVKPVRESDLENLLVASVEKPERTHVV